MKKDGGRAFPKPDDGLLGRDNKCQVGMTLRDYFAAKAMVFISGFDRVDGEPVTFEDIAKQSYELADRMIAEREK